MKDCNISFQNKPALFIQRIYKETNNFHLPKITKTKSQSPNNIYYNEYFTEIRGIKQMPDKIRQNQEKLLKFKFKELDAQKKQQKSLSTKHLYSEQNLKPDINHLQIEPYFVSSKIKAQKQLIKEYQHDLYQQSFILSPNTKIHKEEKEIRKPRFIFQEPKKEKTDKTVQVENDLFAKDQEYDFWKYGYQDDDDEITDYVSSLL